MTYARLIYNQWNQSTRTVKSIHFLNSLTNIRKIFKLKTVFF